MNKSETIGKLAEALAKVQGEIENVHKDKKGYGYMYADLASILEITRPICSKYELCVTQLCESKKDRVIVETVLMHSSGEYISGRLAMPIGGVKGSAAQATGSVISYARRYALAAMIGIAQTDNDAAAKEKETVHAPINPDMVLTPLGVLIRLIEEKGLQDRVAAWCEYFKVTDIAQLTDHDINKLIIKIEENN